MDLSSVASYAVAAAIGIVGGMALCGYMQRSRAPWVYKRLRAHFAPAPVSSVSVTSRQFPARVRADLQHTIDQFLREHGQVASVCGIRMDDSAYFGISLSTLLSQFTTALEVPLDYDEVDIGETEPVRCLGNTLWLLGSRKSNRHAVLISKVINFHLPPQVRVDVAADHTPEGAEFTSRFFQALEESIRRAQSYRGKILSLENGESYTGQATGLKVHSLIPVTREQVILPAKTLELLERNVLQFVKQRAGLAKFGQSLRKGLLFHGSPGNGKTHTIHYLIGELKGHTTLLISAEQVGELSEYMTLARLLAPSLVVLEDVDLIAREREYSGSACQESLLNKLLNEMDGLKADAEIIFLLTTNRPEQLEEALAARPGRIDQAIEFPAPDARGREKLIKLYAKDAHVADSVVRAIVERTDGVSAAFIKELMRRSLQFHLERSSTATLDVEDVESALEELISSTGRLNRRLVGFAEGGVVSTRHGKQGRVLTRGQSGNAQQ